MVTCDINNIINEIMCFRSHLLILLSLNWAKQAQGTCPMNAL